MTMMSDSNDNHDHHLCGLSDTLYVQLSAHVGSFMYHVEKLLQNQLVGLKNDSYIGSVLVSSFFSHGRLSLQYDPIPSNYILEATRVRSMRKRNIMLICTLM